MSDKYSDVIIPMTIIHRFECAMENTKNSVVEQFDFDSSTPEKVLKKYLGFNFIIQVHIPYVDKSIIILKNADDILQIIKEKKHAKSEIRVRSGVSIHRQTDRHGI